MTTSKIYTAEIKVFGDDSSGQVDFYASVFGNVDKHGDVMDAKSFDRTLAEDFRAKNKRLPITFAHALGGGMVPGADPFAFIGYAEASDVMADEHGLRVKAQLNMESDYARTVYGLVKDGLIDQASFTFTVNDEKANRDGSRLIKDVSLYEACLALVGVNGLTSVNAIKSLTTMEEEMKAAAEASTDEEPEEEDSTVPDELRRDIELAAYRMRLMRSETL